jgi:capsule polysaccharide export protein KpsE/RkpR
MNKQIALLQSQIESNKRDIRRCKNDIQADPKNPSLAGKLAQFENRTKTLETQLKTEMSKKV